MAEDRVRITVRTRWESGESFRLILDAPRITWTPNELVEVARCAGEAAGMISEELMTLEIALRWPYAAGAVVHRRF